jgi:hypothetical protein
LPPDICIEIALWDRFGWGPEDTEFFTLRQMRELFSVLEQQRVSKDAVDFKPDERRFRDSMERKRLEKATQEARNKQQSNKGAPNASNPK